MNDFDAWGIGSKCRSGTTQNSILTAQRPIADNENNLSFINNRFPNTGLYHKRLNGPAKSSFYLLPSPACFVFAYSSFLFFSFVFFVSLSLAGELASRSVNLHLCETPIAFFDKALVCVDFWWNMIGIRQENSLASSVVKKGSLAMPVETWGGSFRFFPNPVLGMKTKSTLSIEDSLIRDE